MLEENTLVRTSFGIMPLRNVTSNMYIKTKEGMRLVYKLLSKIQGYYHFFIIDNQYIRFSIDQMFYINGAPIPGIDIKAGESIDTYFGKSYISKKNVGSGRRLFFEIFLDSPRNRYCLYNGVIVSQ